MKKIYYCLIIIFCTIVFYSVQCAASADTEENKILTIPKGTFLKAVNQRELFSANLDEGDIATFINPYAVYLGDYEIIPKNAVFFGYIEKINEPVEGINAIIKVKITKFFDPYTQRETPISAYIYNKGNPFFGGEITEPKYYKKTPHYVQGYKGGYLQYTPTDYRFFGEHIKMKPGLEVLLILNKDFYYNVK